MKKNTIYSAISEEGKSLMCTCFNGEIKTSRPLTCKKCGSNNIGRSAVPTYCCSCCDITIGQTFFYQCSDCKEKFHCKEIWECDCKKGQLCVASFECTACGATASEQIPFIKRVKVIFSYTNKKGKAMISDILSCDGQYQYHGDTFFIRVLEGIKNQKAVVEIMGEQSHIQSFFLLSNFDGVDVKYLKIK